MRKFKFQMCGSGKILCFPREEKKAAVKGRYKYLEPQPLDVPERCREPGWMWARLVVKEGILFPGEASGSLV